MIKGVHWLSLVKSSEVMGMESGFENTSTYSS